MVNNAIPDYAFPSEYGSYLVLNAEQTFNEMMQSIGIEELHSFEENGAVVLEADADAKATEKKVNKVVEWLKARWEDIKGLFDKFLKMIKDLIDKAKKKISDLIGSDKNKKVVADMLSRLKHTGKDGKEKIYGKTFEYGAGYKSIVEKKHRAFHALADLSNFGTSNYSDMSVSEFRSALDSKLKSIGDSLDIGKNNDVNSKSTVEALNKIMRGEEIDITYNYINNNLDDIWDYATNYANPAKNLGTTLKEFQSNFNKAISDFKKTVDKANKKDETFKNLSKVSKEIAKISSAMSGAICNNVRMRTSDSVRIVLRLCIAVKAKKEKVKQESALVPGSFQTELASLFNF